MLQSYKFVKLDNLTTSLFPSRQLAECQCWTIWRRLGKGQTTTGWLPGWIWKLADDHGLLIWIITEMARLSCAGADKLTTNKILYHRRMVGA